MVLRRFLYLDAELTGEFLAQVEGGRFSEEQQTERGEEGKDLSRSTQDERSRTLQQTPESEFHRLTELLGEDGIRFVDAVDHEVWATLKRGEILEIEADLSVATMHKLIEAAGALEPMMAMAEMLGESLDLDDETQMGIQAVTSIGQMTTKVPVVARPAGAPEFSFIASLEPDKLRVETGELEGEATVVAKIQRKLRENDRYSFLDSLPVLSALPREQRREALKGLENSDDMPDMVITAPAAVVTPIAVFR